MRDVSAKTNTLRTARATATVVVQSSTIEAIKSGKLPKADPLVIARVAGIQAAKNTSLLIPYCHQVPLDFVGVTIVLDQSSILIETEVKAIWKTGVEMEALAAASAAALTLYDMLKIIDEEMEIVSVKLLEKKGGKSSMRVTGEGLMAAVVVMSDSVSRGEKEDVSGKALVAKLEAVGLKISEYAIVPDDREAIELRLKTLADDKKVNLIVTTGGTGEGPRDHTPEATLAVVDRRIEGIEETLRAYGQERVPMSMLSRGIVGIRGSTLIVNLPGSVSAVEDGMNAIFPAVLHVFYMMKGGGH